jgi:hypothetical protein
MSAPNSSGPAREVIAPRHESLRKEFDHLPGYGEARLWMVARDPRWLFAYWEFDPAEHPGVRGADGTDHVFLRVIRAGSEGNHVETTVEILPSVGHWYIPVSRTDCDYMAELGYFTEGGVWAYVARSGKTRTPGAAGVAKIASGIRPAPARETLPESATNWGAEEERMLTRLLTEESARASGVRRKPRRTAG